MKRLGFYPIVDRSVWLERFLPLGVTTIQLRIKDLHDDALEAEIARAVVISREFGARLFVNDYWRLALKFKAYGVHLGQEDLATADCAILRAKGIRVGVSTHCRTEVERALEVKPFYMAIGPIFPTALKVMPFHPQGVEGFKHWRAHLDLPLVAIGGITLARAPELAAAGADGIAVVSDVLAHNDPPARVKEWLAKF